MQWGNMLFSDFNIVGASGWIYWNMILDTTGGPWLTSPEHNDPDPNPQQPVIIVDPVTNKYYLTGCYYALAHFGRYVKTGSVRIDVSQRSEGAVGEGKSPISSVAFLHDDSSTVVLVLMNEGAKEHTVRIEYEGYVADVTLPSISFMTLSFTI
jgi:O-glycosyl hydrolase